MFGNLLLMLLSMALLRIGQIPAPPSAILPDRRTLTDLFFGIFFPILYFYLFELLLSWLVANPYYLNQDYTWKHALGTSWYILKSVIFEELVFRGALLLLLIKALGTKRAVLVSSICFGIYHWFSWQAFGNPIQMAIIFLTTGSTSLIYAYLFARTRSMYLVIALHFGANLATMLIFSKDQAIGPQLLVKSFPNDPFVPHALISIPMVILHFTGYQVFTLLASRRYLRLRQTIGASDTENRNMGRPAQTDSVPTNK